MPTYIKKSDVGNADIFARKKAEADANNEDLIHVDVPVIISRSDARDVAKYRAAREMANGVGEQVQISDDLTGAANTMPPEDEKSKLADLLASKNHLVTDDSIYLPNGYDHDTYKRLRAKAEKESLHLRPIVSWDDLPQDVADNLTAA